MIANILKAQISVYLAKFLSVNFLKLIRFKSLLRCIHYKEPNTPSEKFLSACLSVQAILSQVNSAITNQIESFNRGFVYV